MNRAERIAKQLGMSQGAANNRLRKNILFTLLEKHAENRCHVCGLWIDTVDELSIEHIKPWEGRDAELFWDLDNIAFSHVQCNKNHSSNNQYTARMKSLPVGTKWCPKCKQPVELDKFAKNAGSHDGYRSYCRRCDPPR